MVERWFPSAEVSENSNSGWGSGNQERNLFTWFAARPTAQAKAAVICSLLPWPDEEGEQKRLQDLVRQAMTGRSKAAEALKKEIAKANPDGVIVVDPFSGRGMIPLEAARLSLPSFAVDYSQVAVLATALLTDFPFRDWSSEPSLPYKESPGQLAAEPRLVADVRTLLEEVGRRYAESMGAFYPTHDGKQAWGYLWAVTLPCQECGRRFPLFGNNRLRTALTRKATKTRVSVSDPGQAFYVESDPSSPERYRVVLHEGPPTRNPTLLAAKDSAGRKIPGKSAVCPFCGQVHPLEVHRRLTDNGLGRDALLLVADHHSDLGKVFRLPTAQEIAAATSASDVLKEESDFVPGVPARPNEGIAPGNNNIIGPAIYGARSYGDLAGDRQTLGLVRTCRAICDVSRELRQAGFSDSYVRALAGYAASTLVRRLRYSTRGAWLRVQDKGATSVAGIFINEGSLTFSYDWFETGTGDGGATWNSAASQTLRTLSGLATDISGEPTSVARGSATSLPMAEGSVTAVVTDPPYDEMIAYADSSDLFFAWVKRALAEADPGFGVTADPYGAQEKTEEIIVKRSRGLSRQEGYVEHRTRDHYDTMMRAAFREMKRVVREDGLVTIVFGHGEPEVWQRMLSALQEAGLVMTGSWPANTEAGSQQGKANIETTLTMACRPAPNSRPQGRKGAVETQIKEEIALRFPDWERWGLAPTDMLMAAAGPAMEVVGRYESVLDARGEPVDISTFLPLARSAVQDAMAVEVDHHPLETFDARTRFALWWVRLFGRNIAPKSELRWQALAASMELGEVRDLVPDADKGCQFIFATKHHSKVDAESAVIDVALSLAAASDAGVGAMGEVVAASGRDPQDAYLWATVKFLADRFPDSDPDSIAYTRVLRNRAGIGSASQTVVAEDGSAAQKKEAQTKQGRLL